MISKQLRKFSIQAAIIVIFIAALSRFDLYYRLAGVASSTIGAFILALILAVFFAGLLIVYMFDEQKLKRLDFYPQDFTERDEREIALIAKAARKSFIVLDYVFIGGSICAMFAAAALNAPMKGELRAISITLFAIYLVMHAVFLLTMSRYRI
jgi:hypothetical protein